MERIRQLPGLGAIVRLIETWPRVSAWIVLSVGCVALLVIEARDVGLTVGNWIALIVATVIVAALCIWIISWDDDEATEPANAGNSPKS